MRKETRFWGAEFLAKFCLKILGNGRTTVSRVLFEEKSLSLTEFWGKLGEFCEKLGEFALSHKQQAERNSLSSLPGARGGQNKLTEFGV